MSGQTVRAAAAALLACASWAGSSCGSGPQTPPGIDHFRLGMTEAEVRSETTAWTTLNAVDADLLSIIQMQPVSEPLLSPFTPPATEPVLIVKRPPRPARLSVALRDDAVVSIRGETVWVDDFELIRRWLSLRVEIFKDAYGSPAGDSVNVNAIALGQLRGLKPGQEYVTTSWESGPAMITLGLEAHDTGGKRSFSGFASCVDLAKLPRN